MGPYLHYKKGRVVNFIYITRRGECGTLFTLQEGESGKLYLHYKKERVVNFIYITRRGEW